MNIEGSDLKVKRGVSDADPALNRPAQVTAALNA